VVKVPITSEGLKAVKVASKEGIRINMTLVFSPSQALLAAKAGASYISPFVGRVDDISSVGIDVIEPILRIFENYQFKTELIVASIRNPLHVVEAALLGAPIATVPYKVIKQLLNHPLTDIGIKRFQEDWQKIPKM
jgi:transaldolase